LIIFHIKKIEQPSSSFSSLWAMLMSFAYAVLAGLHNNDQAWKGKK